MAHLAQITIYPIKSLPGHACLAGEVLRWGGLEYDRRWAIVDKSGDWMNAKRIPAIHHLRADFQFGDGRAAVTLARADLPGSPAQHFDLAADRRPIEAWLAEFFHQNVTLLERPEGGFPDDPLAPGPTVVSTATLQTVAGWFAGLTLEEVRRRFRANLEIGGVEPFWEDRLVGEEGEVVPFEIGGVRLEGTNACQRCAVPTRDSLNGTVPEAGFAKAFAARREATLPPWAAQGRFDHYYRLAVNTRPAPYRAQGAISVGDPVIVESPRRG